MDAIDMFPSRQKQTPSLQPATMQEAEGSTFPAIEHPVEPPQPYALCTNHLTNID